MQEGIPLNVLVCARLPAASSERFGRWGCHLVQRPQVLQKSPKSQRGTIKRGIFELERFKGGEGGSERGTRGTMRRGVPEARGRGGSASPFLCCAWLSARSLRPRRNSSRRIAFSSASSSGSPCEFLSPPSSPPNKDAMLPSPPTWPSPAARLFSVPEKDSGGPGAGPTGDAAPGWYGI